MYGYVRLCEVNLHVCTPAPWVGHTLIPYISLPTGRAKQDSIVLTTAQFLREEISMIGNQGIPAAEGQEASDPNSLDDSLLYVMHTRKPLLGRSTDPDKLFP